MKLVMTEPPSEDGAAHNRPTSPLPAVAVSVVGAPRAVGAVDSAKYPKASTITSALPAWL